MTRRAFQSAIVLGVVMLAFVSLAQDALADCDTTVCVGKITRLYTQSSGAVVSPVRGAVFIGTDGDETNLACNPQGSGADRYIVLFPNQKLFKEIYASLLAGITNDLSMRVRIDPDPAVCKVAYVTIDR
jgi:hypothetical protein